MKKSLMIVIIGIYFVFMIAGVRASMQDDFISLVNSERARLHLGPVYTNINLTKAAQLYSEDMAKNNYLSHISLSGASFVDRITSAGYVNYYALGENIAYHSGAASSSYVYNMWKNSPGHYANMISSSFNEAGLGVSTINGLTYYTLDLGSRRNFTPIPNQNITGNQTTGNSTVINTTNNTVNNSNSSNLSLNITITKTSSYYYKYFRISGKTNRNAQITYSIPSRNATICNFCSSFSLSMGTTAKNVSLIVSAKDQLGNKVSKTISLS